MFQLGEKSYHDSLFLIGATLSFATTHNSAKFVDGFELKTEDVKEVKLFLLLFLRRILLSALVARGTRPPRNP